jgi:hypothetical protein
MLVCGSNDDIWSKNAGAHDRRAFLTETAEREAFIARQIHMLARRLAVTAILLAAIVHARSLGAEVRVDGGMHDVRLEVQDASVDEALAALGTRFSLKYHSTAPLDRRINGTYEGTLERVISRVLEGYDFILRINPGTIEIIVLRFGKAEPGIAPPTLPPPAAAPAPVPRQAPTPSVGGEPM